MPEPLQLPDGTVVLSNRFGHGPSDDQSFVRVVLPQGEEIEGVYEAATGIRPLRCSLADVAESMAGREH